LLKYHAFYLLFSLYLFNAALHRRPQGEVWFFILPCDWRFLPELGPPPHGLAGFFHVGGLMRAPGREITDLTVCRAVFAGWVFAYHVDLHAHFSALLGHSAGLIRRGYLGVDGFFLLSGLILALVHPELGESRAGSMRFLGKRLARIYPVHLAVLLLLAAVVGIGLSLGVAPRDPGRFTLPSFLENLLLIQGWGIADQLAWNYPSWSVSTEWAGYLLFPALWFYVARLPVPLAAMLVVVCFGLLAFVDFWSGAGLNLTFADALFRFFPEFIIGAATARLLPAAAFVSGRLLAGLGGLVILLALRFAADVLVVAALWMVLAGLARRAVSGRPSLLPNAPLLRFLGVLSYPFYMSFGTVELFLAQLYRHQGLDPSAHRLVYAASMTVVTFVLALSLHHLVENPARRMVDRRLQKKPPLAETGLRL
jgi:peptidoglycan/LPS O-acetylase OafA/YrhL